MGAREGTADLLEHRKYGLQPIFPSGVQEGRAVELSRVVWSSGRRDLAGSLSSAEF